LDNGIYYTDSYKDLFCILRYAPNGSTIIFEEKQVYIRVKFPIYSLLAYLRKRNITLLKREMKVKTLYQRALEIMRLSEEI